MDLSKAPSLVITIDDPDTIKLIGEYLTYITNVQGVTAALDECVEGLIIACLDDDAQFRRWRKAQLPESDGTSETVVEAVTRFARSQGAVVGPLNDHRFDKTA